MLLFKNNDRKEWHKLMLNEMLMGGGYECPVCGRYNCRPLIDYWCSYCGTPISVQILRDIKDLQNRLTIIEETVQQGTELEDIPDNLIYETDD